MSVKAHAFVNKPEIYGDFSKQAKIHDQICFSFCHSFDFGGL